MQGKCLWFGPSIPWGYIGYGLYTNRRYENQVYIHYTNIEYHNLRNPKFRELKVGDVVEFDITEGYRNEGTQAVNVRIVEYAEDDIKDGGFTETNQAGQEQSY